MAYMHESVHVCHLSCRFLMTLPVSKGYPSIFVFGATDKAPRLKIRLNFLHENHPNALEMDKKILKNFLWIKNFLKNFDEWNFW